MANSFDGLLPGSGLCTSGSTRVVEQRLQRKDSAQYGVTPRWCSSATSLALA